MQKLFGFDFFFVIKCKTLCLEDKKIERRRK